ncbi:hypothetical protein BO86DRAFT_433100 [Aspergillus japonicus CBS 114.51]|uniref:Uncharacterized protein n=1 Tax=Aspergillus japonicus CBS 114.51 TaxID=1448312 RepID=A0A8T8WXR8_ASPJA|nr:hypothetical protein BO86DRAFT_433100 [Aspergillus japonicus CBS 114.51]RAH80666.1 hypothetical protein BO86DRAFT_433100 [Aspergillus japonicus CBS 114.51]
MNIAISSGLDVGIQALNLLNKLLEEREIAKSWYGEDKYLIFTQRRCWPLLPFKRFGRLEIRKVFKVKKEHWQKVIENCLSDCSTWHEQMTYNNQGNCSRVESWGLIVLALANGADIQITYTSTGGTNAVLDGQSFILTILQSNIAGPITAHIEPKRYSSDHKTFTSPEWNNLLWFGHSFGEYDHIFGWPLNESPPLDPPEQLVDNVRNQELSRLVIDDHRANRLREQLKDAIHKCHDQWEDLKDIQPSDELMKDIDPIQENLKKLKLILVDQDNPSGSFSLKEERIDDTLEYSEEQLKIVQEKIKERHPTFSHKIIVALTRLLTKPKLIPNFLSTRDAGTYISVV